MNILVLCGGLSNERDVSVSSGSGVARALSGLGHRVALADLYLGLPGEFPDPAEAFQRGLGLGDARIGEDALLRNVIIDKDVVVGSGARLIGTPDAPLVVRKGSIVE